jgi:hypothetical protein
MTMNHSDQDGDGRIVAIHHDGATSCGSYRTGHDTHSIQVLRVAERATPVAVRDVRLIDPVTVELDVDAPDGAVPETLVVRNHDAVRLSAIWARLREGRLVRGASLLQIGPTNGKASFSVTGGELGPCGGRG